LEQEETKKCKSKIFQKTSKEQHEDTCHVKWRCILVNVSWNCFRHLVVALRNLIIKLNEGKPLLRAGLIRSGVLRRRKLSGVIWRFCVRKSYSLNFTKINSLYPRAYWLSELWNACAKGLGRTDVASVSKSLVRVTSKGWKLRSHRDFAQNGLRYRMARTFQIVTGDPGQSVHRGLQVHYLFLGGCMLSCSLCILKRAEVLTASDGLLLDVRSKYKKSS
jgi:hypothetical protein